MTNGEVLLSSSKRSTLGRLQEKANGSENLSLVNSNSLRIVALSLVVAAPLHDQAIGIGATSQASLLVPF